MSVRQVKLSKTLKAEIHKPTPQELFQSAGAIIPKDGDLRWSIREGDHYGWMKCDGRSLSIREYPRLYALIGTRFGGDDDTFKLPNPCDRVVGVEGSQHLIGDALGEETHLLTEDELPSHSHKGQTDAAGTHSHMVIDPTTKTLSGEGNVSIKETPVNDGNHLHVFTTEPCGGNKRHNIIQPTLFIGHVFIYTSD